MSREGAFGREMAWWVRALVMQTWKTKLVVQTHLKKYGCGDTFIILNSLQKDGRQRKEDKRLSRKV